MVEYQDGYIQVTNDCNQECVFCSAFKGLEYMSLDQIKSQLDRYKNEGYTRVVFTGGEPTLHPSLVDCVKYATSLGLYKRIITNGAKLSDRGLCAALVDAGLDKTVFSIHSHKKEVMRKITNRDNLDEALIGITNMISLGCDVSINTTIMSENYKSLSSFISFMTQEYPEIRLYVLNFVDSGGRASENSWVMPKLSDIELELKKSLDLLSERGKEIRVERVPLCYMGDHESVSSETRRIMGDQEYSFLFIEETNTNKFSKKLIYDRLYSKSEACKVCTLNVVCAGLKYGYHDKHGAHELYPLFKNVNKFLDMGLRD